MTLEMAITRRRSRRAFRSDPVALSDLGQLLWAAQGITDRESHRAAPSAGATYPLELYVAATRVRGLEPGVYNYDPDSHCLLLMSPGDKRHELTEAAIGQDCVRFCACILIFAGIYERTTGKYGERGARYVHIEAGAACENVHLQAAVLGLGTVIVGAFDDTQVRDIAHLPENEDPVVMMAVGRT